MKKVCQVFSKIFTVTLASCFFASLAMAASEIRMSSTIGPIDAGIVPLLAEKYEAKTGVKVHYEGAGTGETLKKAKNGGFDLVMVHARKLEDKFVEEGYGVDRRDIMYNDFVILGPKSDPAKISGMTDAAEALKKIAEAKALFVTRGDMSGTHVKETQVWEKAGFDQDKLAKAGDWYHVFADGKKGNKATTDYANEKQSYVLMDRATYLILKDKISLEPLVQGDKILLNLIAVIEVNPEKFPETKHREAVAFMDWLVSDEAQEIIKNFEVAKYGEPLFFPNSKEWHEKHPAK